MKTLYKQTKTGAIQQWTISTIRNKIHIEWGQVGGAQQLSVKTCVAKNVGRSNATTPVKQAILEMESLIKKQKDKGYVENIKTAAAEVKLLPMLAHEYKVNAYSKKSNMKFPFYVQPKLDGVRALFTGDALMSRKGKDYDVAHLITELKRLKMPADLILDGEIYVHGKNLQKISSLVKRVQPASKELEFHIYDVIDLKNKGATYEERLEILNTKVKLTDKTKHLKLVETKKVNKEENLLMFDAIYREKGYEGTILRATDLLYEINQRSRKLLKLKQFRDAEFKIVGVKEGVGKFVGCAIFQCITNKKKTFDVVSPGTLEEKQDYYRNSAEYIGGLLRVKYFDLTEDKIPRFPVGIAVMLNEDR